jgi:RimJ/RimL family protein N-acetyltransferase
MEEVAGLFTRATSEGWRHIYANSSLASYEPPIDLWWQRSLRPKTLFRVAEIDGHLRAFITAAPSEDHDTPGAYEIGMLYVDPDWWGRGLGAELLAATTAWFFDSGVIDATLWTAVANARSRALYERLGWRADGSTRVTTFLGTDADELRYRKSIAPA